MEESDSACYSFGEVSQTSTAKPQDVETFGKVFHTFPTSPQDVETYKKDMNMHNIFMISYYKRWQSFEDWPFQIVKPTKEELAKSGFYYVGISDKVKCFQCGVGLCNWRKNDSAYYEHQRYSNRCSFVKSTQPF